MVAGVFGKGKFIETSSHGHLDPAGIQINVQGLEGNSDIIANADRSHDPTEPATCTSATP